MADEIETGEITEFVCAMVRNHSFEFAYPSSLIDCMTLSTLLQANCIDRMRK